MNSRYDRLLQHGIRGILGLVILAVLAAAPAGPSQAAPGDLVAKVTLPVLGFGVSVAKACDRPDLLYTVQSSNTTGDGLLHRTDKFGTDLGSVPITAPSGALVLMDEIAYDVFNDVLWGCEHGPNPVNVWKINRVTGAATFAFTSVTASVGTFRDGITVDLGDNTLWLSGDVSTTVEHYTMLGGFLGSITPKDAAGANLGSISGIQIGIGDLMYLGRNGLGQIVRVRKSDGGFIGSFSSPGGRDEGLECDAATFFPKTVIWSRDFFSPGFLDAIEVEPGTCTCGGVVPTQQNTWGQLKLKYR
jgi:hypothetical protein